MQSKSALETNLKWIFGIYLFPVTITLTILMLIVFSAEAIRSIVAAFVFRGSVVIFWVIGVVAMILAFFTKRTKSYVVVCILQLSVRNSTKSNLINALLVFGVLYFIAAVISGSEITQFITSPRMLLGRFGDRIIHLLNPRKDRGAQDEAVAGSFARFAGGIAISTLISQLDFPWNMLIFFVYYKFMTAIIFAVIPACFGLWAIYLTWLTRKEFRTKMETQAATEEYPSSDSDVWSESESDEKQFLVRGPRKYIRDPPTYKHEVRSLGVQKHEHTMLHHEVPKHEKAELLHFSNTKSSSVYPSV
jgi:hypothetical protein